MEYFLVPNSKGINPSTGRPWRTKAEYPYSYDAFMTWASHEVQLKKQDEWMGWDDYEAERAKEKAKAKAEGKRVVKPKAPPDAPKGRVGTSWPWED